MAGDRTLQGEAGMNSSYEYQNNRIGEYAVRGYLKRQGYQVARITERHPCSIPFNLIACKNDKIFFIRVKSIRRDRTRKCFRKEVNELSEISSRKMLPGMIQFWVCENCSYKQYQIHAGGAVMIGEYKNGST